MTDVSAATFTAGGLPPSFAVCAAAAGPVPAALPTIVSLPWRRVLLQSGRLHHHVERILFMSQNDEDNVTTRSRSVARARVHCERVLERHVNRRAKQKEKKRQERRGRRCHQPRQRMQRKRHGKRHINDNDNDHLSSQLSVHRALTCSEGQGGWALAPSLFSDMFASYRKIVWVYLCRPGALWNEVDLHLRWKWRCPSLALKSVAGALFAALLFVVALVRLTNHRTGQSLVSSQQMDTSTVCWHPQLFVSVSWSSLRSHSCKAQRITPRAPRERCHNAVSGCWC